MLDLYAERRADLVSPRIDDVGVRARARQKKASAGAPEQLGGHALSLSMVLKAPGSHDS